MNISSVSASSSSSYSAPASGDEITRLEKEKAKLEKELKEANQSKGDAKTKQQKVTQLQNQIQQLQAQIQQLKSEKSDKNQSGGKQAVNSDNVAKIKKDKSSTSGIDENLMSNNIDIQV